MQKPYPKDHNLSIAQDLEAEYIMLFIDIRNLITNL